MQSVDDLAVSEGSEELEIVEGGQDCIIAQPLGGDGEDSDGVFARRAMIWGPTATTPELHNHRFSGGNPDCHKVGDGKWCFKRTNLRVWTPNHRWVFTGQAVVQVVRDNQGSAGWNGIGAPDRFRITLQNPTEIQAFVLTNSRSIDVRLGAEARYYP